MMIAVPVSWHIGSTPPAAMLAFFSRSKATNLSLRFPIWPLVEGPGLFKPAPLR
jgi:hypothetical protein